MTTRRYAYNQALKEGILSQDAYYKASKDLATQERQIKQALDESTGSAKLSSF